MSQLNSVWVFSDNPERYAELFGGAQQWGQQVYAIVQNTDQAQAVMPYGPKCIYVLEQNDALQRTENYAESIAALLKDKHPAMLLLAATKRGKALAARLSVQLNAALVNDATAVDIIDGHICAEHRMYGGLAFAQEKINSPLAIITLAPGVQEPCTSDTSHQCPTETVPYVAPRHEILCRERRAKAASSVDLSKAKRVVGVGRGLAAQDDLKMVHELAAVLNAEVGCSRPIAEGENWMERERYIGVSGVLLKSDLYLTLGISGQIQHMVGGNGAKVIVAINKDKNAPIFNYADYGLVGGGFLYTNKDSISLGLVCGLGDIAHTQKSVPQMLEDFKQHPAIRPLISGGKLLEYSAHMVPEGGLAMVPQMVNDGVMIVGDAAGFCLNLGFTVRGMDLAIASAQAAATTVIAAKEREDFSASSLAQYKRELEQSCVMRDMQHFRKIPALMENPRLFSQYPRMVADIMNEMFTIDGKPNQPVRKMIMGHAKKIGLINLLKDGIKGATAL